MSSSSEVRVLSISGPGQEIWVAIKNADDDDIQKIRKQLEIKGVT